MQDDDPAPLVLVGFDDSPAGRAALATAADLAGRMSGRLEVLHAVPPVTPMTAPSGLMADGFAVPPPADTAQHRAATASSLSAVVGGLLAGCSVPWTFEVVDGDAVTVLEEHAAGAYLVVVGTRHAGIGTALDRLLTGSTSRALQKRCPRPVLVVPEPHHH